MAEYRTADGSLRCAKGRFADPGDSKWPPCEGAATWRSPDYYDEQIRRDVDMSWAVWCEEHKGPGDRPMRDPWTRMA